MYSGYGIMPVLDVQMWFVSMHNTENTHAATIRQGFHDIRPFLAAKK